MRLTFVVLAATFLVVASQAPAVSSAGIDSPPLIGIGLHMQAGQPQSCFIEVSALGWCIGSPITLAFVNDALLNIVRPWITGLGGLLDQLQNSAQNFLTTTPAFWDLPEFFAIRLVTLFVAYGVALQIIGFWVALKMLMIEFLKNMGMTSDFVVEAQAPEGTFTQFLIGACAPVVMFGLIPWLIGINNDFCAALNVSLRDIALPPPTTDNFLILAVTALPYLAFDLMIGVALALRFFFLVVATLASVLATAWLLKKEWTDLFQMFLTLIGCLIAFQLGVMVLLWVYLTFVLTYAGGTGMSIAHTIFLGGVFFLIWKSRKWMGMMVQRAGLQRLQFWGPGPATAPI